MTEARNEFMRLVDKCRQEQERRWGKDDHSPTEWVALLTEELGKLSKAANEITYTPMPGFDAPWSRYYQQSVELAAVCAALFEQGFV